MHLPPFFWLVFTSSILCVQTSDSHTILADPAHARNTSIATPLTGHATCYTDATGALQPALLDDCYKAVRLILVNKKIVLPQTFGKRMPADVQMPWVSRFETCLVLLDTMEREIDTFLLIRVAYYAAELIQPCIANRPYSPLGGRVGLDKQNIFVAITGILKNTATEDLVNSTMLRRFETVRATSEV